MKMLWTVTLVLVGLLIPLAQAAIVTYNLTASTFEHFHNGKRNMVEGLNGVVPSPTLTVRVGDTFRVHIHNHLTGGLSLHWHGFEVRKTPWHDGVTGVTQCAIPNGAYEYVEFVIEEYPGTYWYHSHSGLAESATHAING